MNERTREDTKKAQDRTQKDSERAQEKTKPRTEQTQKDHEKAQGKSFRRSPHAILAKTHKEHPEYHTTQAYARSLRASKEKPEDFGRSGSFGDDDAGGSSGSSTVGEEDESISTPNAMGKVDPFYVFDRTIPSEEITDQGVHNAAAGGVGVPVPSPASSFNAIVAIDGKPFRAGS